MLIFNVVFNNDFQCLFFIIFFRVYFFHNIVSAEIIFLYSLIFYFLICQQILFYFILLIFIAILFFLFFFYFRIAYIFRFFPIFILFPSKTYIFYYDNAGPPYTCDVYVAGSRQTSRESEKSDSWLHPSPSLLQYVRNLITVSAYTCSSEINIKRLLASCYNEKNRANWRIYDENITN